MDDCSSVVQVGSRVCVRDDDGEAEFHIVEPEFADAYADRVSGESPLGRALLGRRAGEEFALRVAGFVRSVTVVAVR